MSGYLATNADNGAFGPGATFDFSDLMEHGTLAPKQSTAPKTLRFQLKDVRLPEVDEKDVLKVLRLEFINLDLQILGPK